MRNINLVSEDPSFTLGLPLASSSSLSGCWRYFLPASHLKYIICGGVQVPFRFYSGGARMVSIPWSQVILTYEKKVWKDTKLESYTPRGQVCRGSEPEPADVSDVAANRIKYFFVDSFALFGKSRGWRLWRGGKPEVRLAEIDRRKVWSHAQCEEMNHVFSPPRKPWHISMWYRGILSTSGSRRSSRSESCVEPPCEKQFSVNLIVFFRKLSCDIPWFLLHREGIWGLYKLWRLESVDKFHDGGEPRWLNPNWLTGLNVWSNVN